MKTTGRCQAMEFTTTWGPRELWILSTKHWPGQAHLYVTSPGFPFFLILSGCGESWSTGLVEDCDL